MSIISGLLTVEDAATELNCCPETVRRYTRLSDENQRLRCQKVGRVIFISRHDLLGWINMRAKNKINFGGRAHLKSKNEL